MEASHKENTYQMQAFVGIKVLQIIKTWWADNHLFWGSSKFTEL